MGACVCAHVESRPYSKFEKRIYFAPEFQKAAGNKSVKQEIREYNPYIIHEPPVSIPVPRG